MCWCGCGVVVLVWFIVVIDLLVYDGDFCYDVMELCDDWIFVFFDLNWGDCCSVGDCCDF